GRRSPWRTRWTSSRRARAGNSTRAPSRRSSARSPTPRRSPSPARRRVRCTSPPRSRSDAADARPIDAPHSGSYVAPMSDTLMVGVSGVRGIVGKDLTPEVVARWAMAFGLWAREHRPAVVVGRDARPSGPEFAQAAIAALRRAGCDVIDVGLVPTPTVQLAVEHHHAGGGIAITASHNPIEWNALKFIGPDGIFLDGDAGARVRALADEGAGKGRGEGERVSDCAAAVERHLGGGLGADTGRAVDPEVDRLGLGDETGAPIGEDYTLAFAVRAVLEPGKGEGGRGKGNTVVCNLSTSLVVEDAARDCGATVVRTPV